jgi:hypothetical protein
MTTLAAANRQISKAGIPLELVRGEGYHYFIYDIPAENVFDTESVYVCYTNTYTAKEWVKEAAYAMAKILENAR